MKLCSRDTRLDDIAPPIERMDDVEAFLTGLWAGWEFRRAEARAERQRIYALFYAVRRKALRHEKTLMGRIAGCVGCCTVCRNSCALRLDYLFWIHAYLRARAAERGFAQSVRTVLRIRMKLRQYRALREELSFWLSAAGSSREPNMMRRLYRARRAAQSAVDDWRPHLDAC